MKEVHWGWVLFVGVISLIGAIAAINGDYALGAYLNTAAILVLQRT